MESFRFSDQSFRQVGYVFLHSRDYRHAGIEEDEEHDETAHKGPKYDT